MFFPAYNSTVFWLSSYLQEIPEVKIGQIPGFHRQLVQSAALNIWKENEKKCTLEDYEFEPFELLQKELWKSTNGIAESFDFDQ